MKITVTDLDSVLTAIVLGDDSVGDYILEPPMIDEARAVQEEELAFADYESAEGRGNKKLAFHWKVVREHASKAAAAAFVIAHGPLVPENASIEIQEGATDVTYSKAVIERVACVELNGKSTAFRYTVTGAQP